MKKVLVAGSLNMDLVVSVPRFPKPGETLLGSSYKEHIGGKGANQASAAALQGAPVSMWGMIGRDAHGQAIGRALESLSIQNALKTCEVHTGLALIEVSPEGQNRIVVVPGANGVFSPEEAQKQEDLIQSHDIILLQHEIPLSTNLAIAKIAKKYGKTVLLNPAPAAEISQEMLQYIDYLLPNEHELSLISGKPAENPDQILAAMLHLQSLGCPRIITTAGIQGAFFLRGQQFLHTAAPKMKAVDTTGAGDALCGSFAAHLARGETPEDSLKYAVWAASISVTRAGAFGSAGTFAEVEEALL